MVMTIVRITSCCCFEGVSKQWLIINNRLRKGRRTFAFCNNKSFKTGSSELRDSVLKKLCGSTIPSCTLQHYSQHIAATDSLKESNCGQRRKRSAATVCCCKSFYVVFARDSLPPLSSSSASCAKVLRITYTTNTSMSQPSFSFSS